ncbi:hypothetical protein VZT92_026914 [Zoarces viviparus]|uniref:Uncharacterized protein n=1 Tax=Zoarces viviparus TaxID=48416 RepID=A0AAW1DT28_ZOAVI
MLCGKIKECLDNIRPQEGYDKVTVNEAFGLSIHLLEPKIQQLLQFFSELMAEVDILYNLLQKQEIDEAGINQAMGTIKKNVGRLRERANVIVRESGAEGNKRKINTYAIMKKA